MESTLCIRATRQALLTGVLIAALLRTVSIGRDAALSAQVLSHKAWGPAAASAECLLAAYAAADPERITDLP